MSVQIKYRPPVEGTRKVKGVITPSLSKGGMDIEGPNPSRKLMDAQRFNSRALASANYNEFMGRTDHAKQEMTEAQQVAVAVKKAAELAKIDLSADDHKLAYLAEGKRGASSKVDTREVLSTVNV